MKNTRIQRYRQKIAQLSMENEALKSQVKKYDEEGFSKLVDDTLKMKEEYTALLKEAFAYKTKYEKLADWQRQFIDNCKKDIHTIQGGI